MFLKNFRVKSNTAIRGSDRRKLRNDVLRELPYITQETISDIIPNKEDMTVMKITTHSGQNVTAYTLNGSPIFFQLDQTLYPTVYLLWKYPDILLSFTTWPNVFERIQRGADLMLPGIISSTGSVPDLKDFQKDNKCSVSLLGNKAAVAIGYTAVSASEAMQQGMKGKGVIILHSYMDQLWCQGSKCDIPLIEMKMLETDGCTFDNDLTVEQNVENFTTKTDPKDKNESSGDNQPYIDSNTLTLDDGVDGMIVSGPNVDEKQYGSEDTQDVQASSALSDETISGETMDNRLTKCFLGSLLTIKTDDMPILTSTFYKSYMLSCCPLDETIDIKKSSFKKLTKFLQEMENQGYITMKELTKGVHSIDNINWDSQDLKSFKKENPGFLKENVEVEDEQVSSKYQPPDIEEVLAVSAVTQPLFKECGCCKGTILSSKDVRGLVTDYIKSQELFSTENKRNVRLNPVLFAVVHQKGEPNIDSLPWDELFRRIMNRMNPCHKITFPGRSSVVRKGKLEPIDLNIAQRMGNKKVTLVNNLECYGIDPAEFAHKLQLKAATSTSVSELPGKVNKLQQVLIQGNQIQHVGTTLQDEYRIPKKYIRGLEKSKQKKK